MLLVGASAYGAWFGWTEADVFELPPFWSAVSGVLMGAGAAIAITRLILLIWVVRSRIKQAKSETRIDPTA